MTLLGHKLLSGLKHAFAVEDSSTLEPTPRQKEIIESVCREITARGMTTPAIVSLESARPLNFVGAQAMHFFSPVVSALFDGDAHKELAKFLEHRGSVEYIIRQLEEMAANHPDETPKDSTTDA
ncbi:hypothetical protein [Calycomorphotria hydatis]|uniref:Uncharacterized protein n=1 Tax=Calycomorphotria hydatis TaxID=2528027 RepID=A0A517T6P3_9PLAN|nr:hypothetical protein [Calycomorphotria hydatis]QDT64041.1 hypothetical protein V22_12710 [Calycomorphotria hydatis]